ncbi:MAG: 8-amino-7-oxononanoate synthase [Solirubrobacteraceae bacterium]
MSELQQRLEQIERRGLRRRLRLVEGPQGARVLLEGRPVTLLCSNNYLGLANDSRVRQAAADAALRDGAGAGASRLISGTMTPHRELERALADFEGTQSCLLFGSGYLANLGVIGALAERGDVVFSDELNHASIVDGCRLSRARVVVYRHLDADHLAWCLERERGVGRALVATDSVFSMDGDLAPLSEIVRLARRHEAQVLVDEAHAIGAIGADGRGAVAAAGLVGEVDALLGTLGKALGSYGAFVCGSETTVSYLLNVARSFIFSTAPPPPAVAAAHASLELLRGGAEDLPAALRRAARTLRRALRREGFAVAESEMHIVPLLLGESERAVALCEAALQRGVFAQAIRPPTVPEGTSRLRLAAIATHAEEELATAAAALRQSAESLGMHPAEIGEALSAVTR